MPLSPPAARKLQHTRAIECKGYEREDGLWDIEAHLVDTKTYVHTRRHGGRERMPGEPVHDMWLRLTIDLDMHIHDAEACTDSGPYPYCGDITPRFKSLVGLRIGRGWRREVNARLGGIKGCTHLVEQLGPLGTTAFQATGRAREARSAGQPTTKRPYQIGSCHVYREDSPAVLERWPAFYKPAEHDELTNDTDAALTSHPMDRALLTDPAAWVGRDIQNDRSWVYGLAPDAVEEIDCALAHAKRSGARIPFDKALFPLPRFSLELNRILNEVESGRGFILVRGIPRDRYSDEDCELLYWGLGIHLGTPVSQNARGHLLGHVRDEGRVHADPNARGYQTRQRMDFHTDLLPVDIVGLFCARTAKSGGESKVVSALTLHNVLRDERPDLLEALYGTFNVDWRGEEPTGEKPFFTIPMFSDRNGKVTTRLVSVPYYKSVSRFGDEHAPSALQLEALEMVQEIANRPELMLSMDFQEGDVQLLNNHTTLHARTEFEDHDEPGMQRHLLRMWIAVDEGRRRPLADALSARYEWVRRGGIPPRI